MPDHGSRKENVFPADAYLRTLSLASVPEEKRRWYVRWVERFAEFLGEKPLDAAEREDAEAFMALLGRRPRTEAWQVRQATDAVRILLTAVFGKTWMPGVSDARRDGGGHFRFERKRLRGKPVRSPWPRPGAFRATGRAW